MRASSSGGIHIFQTWPWALSAVWVRMVTKQRWNTRCITKLVFL
jgi:hypothetical protein